MQLPTTSDERFAFISALEYRLKPERFWVTDFLAQRLMDVEWTFCGGEKENAATVKRCAEYSRDILQAMNPDKVDFGESLQLVAISASAKEEVRDLFALGTSMDAVRVTTQQACGALSAFLQLVYTRDFS
ncbi:hypothetical protein [Massilia sp. YIM B04103]|uniref:hypothetical protein n=1 Tax=Massilia sp. YIM B04103 TaxID=2963106 RepID=UPI00210A307B|nr:hypothetical protein [Massilia sp. YIM B04103]